MADLSLIWEEVFDKTQSPIGLPLNETVVIVAFCGRRKNNGDFLSFHYFGNIADKRSRLSACR
jgi:hypothetical protein